VRRFGVNVYETKRPTAEETANYLQALANRMELTFVGGTLERVAGCCKNDLRVCADFVYTAHKQVPDADITHDYLDLVFGKSTALDTGNVAKTRLMPAL